MSDYLAPFAAILIPNLAGIAGSFITKRSVKTWYQTLKLPTWSPPNKAFPIVWPILYSTMGYASYLVWRDGGGFAGDAASPIAWYGAQLILNLTWSQIFFGFRSPKWAFVEGVVLWGAIARTISMFHDINETAAYLLMPYLAWCTYAFAVNFQIWRDNPDKKD